MIVTPRCRRCGDPRHLLECPSCGGPVSCRDGGPSELEGFFHIHRVPGCGARWWAANAGPQERFVASDAREILYGGSAGGGKTVAQAAIPLRFIHLPHYRAIGFRRETPQLRDIVDKADALYRVASPPTKDSPGVKRNRTENSWTFPSGAVVRFTHLQNEGDEAAHDGQEYQTILWDELTHFTERQYKALKARLRSGVQGLPRIIRATTNPGGTGAEWVFRHWGPWLDPDWEPDHRYEPTHGNGAPLVARHGHQKLPPAEPGEVLYIIDTKDGTRYVPKGTRDDRGQRATARTFIPARLIDNPILTASDPAYVQNLMGLDPLRRAQLLDGDWLAKAGAGDYFKRAWFEIVDAGPVEAVRARFWDRASTVAEKGKDPDWTVGLKYAWDRRGSYWIEHVVRMRGTPKQVEDVIVQTALADNADHHNRCSVVLAQDPGQAGKSDVDHYIMHDDLRGIDVRTWPERGDKQTRANPVSAQCEHGNVKIVRGVWNQVFLDELEAFPEGNHDDDVDALSGAHNWMAQDAPSRILKPRHFEPMPRGY